jgi:hypothetical protein
MTNNGTIHRVRVGRTNAEAQLAVMRIEYHLNVKCKLVDYSPNGWYADFEAPKDVDLDFLRPDVLPPLKF